MKWLAHNVWPALISVNLRRGESSDTTYTSWRFEQMASRQPQFTLLQALPLPMVFPGSDSRIFSPLTAKP